MKELPDPIIDFHVHLFPDKGFDAIWKFFDTVYKMPALHHLYYRECIAYLRDRGVGPLVFSNYAHKKGVAPRLNEWNLSVLSETPDLFCFAAYHPDDGNSLRYAEEMLSHDRVVGIKLHFLVQQFYPHDKRLFPLYEMVIARNKRLLFHAGTLPSHNKFLGFKNFNTALRHFPDLPVTVAHMGGFEYSEFMGLLDEHPNLYLDTAYTFWPYVPGGFNLGKEYLERYKDRILYGSDFPNVVHPREDEIASLLRLDLSRDFYDTVFRGNGIKLLSNACNIDTVENAIPVSK